MSVEAATLSHVATPGTGAVFAAAPQAAGIYYRAALEDGTAIHLDYLHLRQQAGQVTVEGHALGALSDNPWFETASGQTLSLISEARTITGAVVTAETVLMAVVESVTWTGSQLRLFAVGSVDGREPRTVAIDNVLYLQTKSSGARSIRFPLVWGLQAGDTVTHDTIGSFVLDMYALTIQRNYKIVDATESA